MPYDGNKGPRNGINKKLGQGGRNTKVYTRFTPERREAYLAYLTRTARLYEAANQVNVTPQAILQYRRKNPSFEERVQNALRSYNDLIEAEIHRRGVDGFDQAVYWNGEVVGYQKKYSDALLGMLAKRRIPEYGDRISVEQNTTISGELGISLEPLSGLSVAGRAKLRELLQSEGEGDLGDVNDTEGESDGEEDGDEGSDT